MSNVNPQHVASSPSRVKMLECDIHSVNMSQLNNSSSKMQYSIPKSVRWVQDKHELQSSSKFYELPAIKSNRSTSFGYGQKIDISKQGQITPAPGTYKEVSDFKHHLGRGISFSPGRDVIKSVAVFGEKPFKVPGPQQYEIKYPQKRQSATLGIRIQELSNKWILAVPGPGTYQTVELLDRNLKSKISTISSVPSGRFSTSLRKSQEELQTKFLEVPGPGKYALEKTYEIAQKFPRKRGQRFGKSQRQGIVEKSITPGPGSYGCFSEFLH